MFNFFAKLFNRKKKANNILPATKTAQPDILKGIKQIPATELNKDTTPPIKQTHDVSLNPPIQENTSTSQNTNLQPTSTKQSQTQNRTIQNSPTQNAQNPVDEQRILGLLKQAEMAKNFAWEKAKKQQQHHTKIPVYTGNPFSIGDCKNCLEEVGTNIS